MTAILLIIIDLFITIIMVIGSYYYSLKVYGFKITITMAVLFALFILSQVYTGAYAIADLYLFPLFKLRFGNSEFLLTDPITIFPTFLITFELGRISLGKRKNSISSWKDVILVSLLVSFFGFCFQLIIDLSASAIGLYYYQNPPQINIFGYPIIFFMAFPFYGFIGFIFLSMEYYIKRIKKIK